jgi:predicted TIM-barrel fold metal-dependent hydrolase
MTKPIAAPDRNPRRPRLTAPPRACDCHCHVFGPAARFPYVAERQYTPPDSTLEDYLGLLGVLGIERAVIVQPSVYGTDNSATEDGIRRMDGRGRGVAVVDGAADENELGRLHQAGFRGVRFNLIHTGGSASLDLLEELAARVAPLGWHVQIYLHGRLLPQIADRLKALPTDLVIDHLGHMERGQGLDQPGFKILLDLLGRGRTWVKLCPYRFDPTGFPWVNAAPLARALAAAAPERMLWGTDWPHPDIPGLEPGTNGPMPNDGDLLDVLAEWFEDRALIDRILADNPDRLYFAG